MRHRSRSLARLLTVADPARVMGRDRPGANARRSHRSGDGHVGRVHPGRERDRDQHGHQRHAQHRHQRGGLYAFPGLPPGVYELKVELQGFKTAEIPTFKVDVQQTVRVDVPLQVGALNETVTVAGRTALLNTESTTIGTVIENKVVTELPLNGRQYLNLVALAPNVNVLSPAAGQAGARLGGERAAQSISAGGQRIFFNYYTLDGVNNTDPNFKTTSPCRRSTRSRSSRSRPASTRPSSVTRARR